MSRSKVIYTNKQEVAELKLTGARLKEARELNRYLTQNQAAILIGTSVQALADAENGRLNPLPLKFLKAAAETYAVSSDWLLGLVEDWEQGQARDRDFLAGLQRIHLRHYSKLVARHLEASEEHQAQEKQTFSV